MTATAHRRRILGDVGESAPENWQWGEPDGTPVHVLLLLYAPDNDALAAFYESHRSRFEQGGLALVKCLDTVALQGRKEHFGFRDGIAQPQIAGYKEGSAGNTIRPGEFLFGYLDE